jgi:hypothetical protein
MSKNKIKSLCTVPLRRPNGSAHLIAMQQFQSRILNPALLKPGQILILFYADALNWPLMGGRGTKKHVKPNKHIRENK